MVKIPGMFEENKQYELVPGEDDHWHIRIMEGDYIETVMSFGQISIDEKSDTIKFNFDIHYTPDPDLTVDDYHFQKYAAKVLESIMINNLNEMENK